MFRTIYTKDGLILEIIQEDEPDQDILSWED